MGDGIDWPVFLLDGGDVAVFTDNSALTKEVEPWMVDQTVEFIDATARPLLLQVAGRRTLGVVCADAPPAPDRLRNALSHYLGAIGAAVPTATEMSAFAKAAARLIQ
ncbi:MAG: hypothetical protein QOH74_1692 [Gaiellales bacterium]|jgi:hypothetical protein|nr:hypothetical protein [Gaiellales bacterium]